MSSNSKSIPIKIAKERVKKWQLENSNKNVNDDLIHAKAFLISANDLIDCLIEMEVLKDKSCINTSLVANASVRAYMAIDRAKGKIASADTERLVLVSTVKEVVNNKIIHRDIIEGYTLKNPPPYKLVGTGTFDFTKPCPSNCDTESPLYNP
ncbi:hypothetical protein KO494_05720 [Lacinutrix sp. C3R15]|uniref:hypothetical protein n=1 Tax=Flavobacteriaceae TaxID=49546 RepID=UPI001C0998D7|nr:MULTISPECIES: hypothetical protein [Flavobacteriaceae]MBU2939035.1 hypothetical protein [Lacinutrix sp. C3R15]MDO6622350.1 hypothetical protein [Oceanihabitans sp. 1_MG-2023]